MEEILLYFALKYNGNFKDIFNALQTKEQVDLKLKDKLFHDFHGQYVTITNDNYPDKLRAMNCPPIVLFYKGNYELLNTKSAALIGSETPTDQGKIIAQKIVQNFNERDITVVTGSHQGTDEAVYHEALKNHGKIIKVLTSNINCLDEHINNDTLIISEQPFNHQCDRTFQQRILSALSDFMIVTELHEYNKENMIAINQTLDDAKNIYAVGDPINENNLCNELIAKGAIYTSPYLIDSILDYEEFERENVLEI